MPLPNMIPDTPPLPIGTPTRWGKIQMVGITGGERYYWMADKGGSVVSMMPAMIVEPEVSRKVKLPAEVGLAPLPKTDRRAYRQRPKQPRKWLTKAELIAKGYSL